MITTSSGGRFLIIQTAFIGDVILATALIEQLRVLFPEATLDVLLRRGNEGLLAGHPHLGNVLIWEKKGGLLAKYGRLYELHRQLRARPYDVVINLQRFGATGLLTARSGARLTVGFDKNPFARYFACAVPHRIEPGVHEIDRNASLLRCLTNQPIPRLRPQLYPQPADRAAVQPYQAEPYVCVAPTSVWFTKQYPANRWVRLLDQLPTRLRVYLLGGPPDADACDQIARQTRHGNVVNLSGRLSLLQSAALMQGAVMNYVNDSAPLHMASAVNAPTTAVFCSTVPEFGFGPLADVVNVVQYEEPLECRPCNLHGQARCPLGHFQCANGIRIEQLLQALPTT